MILTPLALIAILLIAGLATIVIYSPAKFRLKALALVTASILMIGAYLGGDTLLGRPKSVTLEWLTKNAYGATVIAADPQENHAIYLWITSEGETEPRAFAIPWSIQTASELQGAFDMVERRGGRVRIGNGNRNEQDKPSEGGEAPRGDGEPGDPSGGNSGGDSSVFYPEPQPPLPPKSGTGN